MSGPLDDVLKDIRNKDGVKENDEEVIDNDDVFGILKDLYTGNKHLVPDDFLEETLDEINDFLDNEADKLPDSVRRFVKAITKKAREDVEKELSGRGIKV